MTSLEVCGSVAMVTMLCEIILTLPLPKAKCEAGSMSWCVCVCAQQTRGQGLLFHCAVILCIGYSKQWLVVLGDDLVGKADYRWKA